MSPNTLEIVRCALQSVYETGGTIEEQALIEQADHISELVIENAKLKEALHEIANSDHLGNSWARHKAKEALAAMVE